MARTLPSSLVTLFPDANMSTRNAFPKRLAHTDHRRKTASPDPRQVRGEIRRGSRKTFVLWLPVAIAARVASCTFHSAAPLGGRLGADEGPSTHPHCDRRVTTFRQIVEMCAADSVSAAELRDREREHLRQERLRGRLKFA